MGRQADRLARMEAVELLERDGAVARVVQQGDLLGEVVGRDGVERVGLARELARGGDPVVQEHRDARRGSSPRCSRSPGPRRSARPPGRRCARRWSATGAGAPPGAAASSPHAAASSAMAARMAGRTGRSESTATRSRRTTRQIEFDQGHRRRVDHRARMRQFGHKLVALVFWALMLALWVIIVRQHKAGIGNITYSVQYLSVVTGGGARRDDLVDPPQPGDLPPQGTARRPRGGPAEHRRGPARAAAHLGRARRPLPGPSRAPPRGGRLGGRPQGLPAAMTELLRALMQWFATTPVYDLAHRLRGVLSDHHRRDVDPHVAHLLPQARARAAPARPGRPAAVRLGDRRRLLRGGGDRAHDPLDAGARLSALRGHHHRRRLDRPDVGDRRPVHADAARSGCCRSA